MAQQLLVACACGVLTVVDCNTVFWCMLWYILYIVGSNHGMGNKDTDSYYYTCTYLFVHMLHPSPSPNPTPSQNCSVFYDRYSSLRVPPQHALFSVSHDTGQPQVNLLQHITCCKGWFYCIKALCNGHFCQFANVLMRKAYVHLSLHPCYSANITYIR